MVDLTEKINGMIIEIIVESSKAFNQPPIHRCLGGSSISFNQPLMELMVKFCELGDDLPLLGDVLFCVFWSFYIQDKKSLSLEWREFAQQLFIVCLTHTVMMIIIYIYIYMIIYLYT